MASPGPFEAFVFAAQKKAMQARSAKATPVALKRASGAKDAHIVRPGGAQDFRDAGMVGWRPLRT